MLYDDVISDLDSGVDGSQTLSLSSLSLSSLSRANCILNSHMINSDRRAILASCHDSKPAPSLLLANIQYMLQ